MHQTSVGPRFRGSCFTKIVTLKSLQHRSIRVVGKTQCLKPDLIQDRPYTSISIYIAEENGFTESISFGVISIFAACYYSNDKLVYSILRHSRFYFQSIKTYEYASESRLALKTRGFSQDISAAAKYSHVASWTWPMVVCSWKMSSAKICSNSYYTLCTLFSLLGGILVEWNSKAVDFLQTRNIICYCENVKKKNRLKSPESAK